MENLLVYKNADVVFALLEEFKKIRFVIRGKDYSLMFNFSDAPHKFFEEYYTEKLVFSHEYFLRIEKILAIADNPFMPKSIAEKVEKLMFPMLSFDITKDDIDKYAKVVAGGLDTKKEKFGRFNGKDMTLLEFINLVDDVKSAMRSWIAKNSNNSPDLDINHLLEPRWKLS